MRAEPRDLACWIAAAYAWAAPSPGVARAQAERPVLHEYVPDVDPDEPIRLLAAERGEGGAVVYGGEIVEMPDAPAAGPAMSAAPGDGALGEEAGKRSPTFEPDRMTQLEGTLDYYEGFTPSIAPFKRVTSLDAVVLAGDGRTPVLAVRDPRRTAVRVEGVDAAAPDARPRDRFWGQARVDFADGNVVPLPSVSPESRILSLHADPPTEVLVERDGAGNFFVAALGTPPSAPVALTFLTDAPRAYFGAEVPEVSVATLARDVPALAPAIRERALAFAAEIGLTPASDLRTALGALVGHFRAFEESSEPPRDTGDAYLDLARGKKGICRHRAYAFVVTAQALGIPAHFVQNEAHSWVEVKLPSIGWMRVDLGGAAHGLTAHGASQRPLYVPAQPDRLPRPPAYARSYSQLAGSARGLKRPGVESIEGRWIEAAPAAASSSSTVRAATDTRATSLAMPALGDRRPLRVTLDRQRMEVLRGRKLTVTGRIEGPDRSGVPGLRVEVSLAAQGRADRMLLGVTVTGEGGYFRGAFGVPPDLEVGDYRLVVVTPGDDAHLPATSE